MSDMESRLTEAMKARARDVEPRDEDAALEHITRRVKDRRRRALVVLGVAAAVAVAVGGIALVRRDTGKSSLNVTTKPSESSTSSASTTTTSSGPPPSIVPTKSAYLWPPPSSTRTFTTPQDAAKSFAVEYLGMTLARVGKVIDTPTKSVEIFPSDTASARTLVDVAGNDTDGWGVMGASADQLKINNPAAGSQLTSPLEVTGDGTAFEAQIAIELRPVGSVTPVLKTSTMAGANGQVGPYATTIIPPSTDQPLVLLAYEPDASDRGQMIQASVVRLEAAGEGQPATFVGTTATGDLVHLDFAGHIQRTLAQGVVEISFAPSVGLVAYSHTRSCGVDFAYVEGGAPPTAIANASAPIFGPGGAQLSYQVCGGGRRLRTLATGADTDTPADFVVSLPDGVHGELPTLRGRFGTFAFFDGTNIASYDPATGKVVTLVHPAARVSSLDADESGRYLIWTDANLDVWTWSGGEPVKVASGFNSAAW